MSILKNKIAKAQRLRTVNTVQASKLILDQSSFTSSLSPSDLSIPSNEGSRDYSYFQRSSSTKVLRDNCQRSCQNVVKNYGRAFTNFALSSLSSSYLVPMLIKEGLSLEDFSSYIIKIKSNTNCIKNLRNALLAKSEDDVKIIAAKRVFQSLCEVFLKFFCVNWLFNSKIDNKIAHLNCRFKILRRIRNPEHFTYLEGFGY